jgi:hypothetical protein
MCIRFTIPMPRLSVSLLRYFPFVSLSDQAYAPLQYAHPIETLFLGIGTAAGPIVSLKKKFQFYMFAYVMFQSSRTSHDLDFPRYSPARTECTSSRSSCG